MSEESEEDTSDITEQINILRFKDGKGTWVPAELRRNASKISITYTSGGN